MAVAARGGGIASAYIVATAGGYTTTMAVAGAIAVLCGGGRRTHRGSLVLAGACAGFACRYGGFILTLCVA